MPLKLGGRPRPEGNNAIFSRMVFHRTGCVQPQAEEKSRPEFIDCIQASPVQMELGMASAEYSKPCDFSDLRAKIEGRYATMSKQLQVIADFALAFPEVTAIETVAQLSQRLSLAPSTFIRFAQALDYSGFSEMKRDFSSCLDIRMRDMAAPEVSPSGGEDLLSRSLRVGMEELCALNVAIDRTKFDEIAGLLARANTIFVTAQHLSYPLAALFTWSLLQEGHECILLDNAGGFALRQSQLAGPKDVTLAISFAPYQPSVVQQAYAHQERGGTVIAITDSEVSPLATAATHSLILQGPAPNRAGTLAGVTCLIGALATAMIEARMSRGEKA